ncbi:MAG: CapA family protein [Alphaproteobacteria bacterium]|nr:CapA family protein [Alphaproteobacteria bacterium]
MPDTIRLFLCGDVMIGRGIDQILPHPCAPRLYERGVASALDYVALAESRSGPIARAVDADYVWGAALDVLARCRPDVRIVNLETSITRSATPAPKGINYRVSPENAACLSALAPDCCVLANNHVLDWGHAGLRDTLAALQRLGIATAGAGLDAAQAAAPACLDVAGKARVLVFAFAAESSGTPREWAADDAMPGVHVLPDLSEATAARIADDINRQRQPRDVVVVSLHWGSNWGYEVTGAQRRFAQALVERAAVAIVHGHSSHHPRPIEVHRDRLVLYGCGDFLNDYEGIGGYEEFRGDLVLMYVADVRVTDGTLIALELVPLRLRRFQLMRPSAQDVDWLRHTLERACRPCGTAIVPLASGRFALSWTGPPHAPPPTPAPLSP